MTQINHPIKSNSKKTAPLLNKLLFALLLTLGMTGCFSSSSGTGGGDGDGSALIDEELSLGEDARFGSGNIPGAKGRDSGPFQDINFAYDSSSVDSRYHEMLRMSAQELVKDSTLKTEVEGHCDKRGTQEYNLALGEERAKAAAGLLVQYGANPRQVSTISYGSEIPLDPSENEAAYAKNRRVHFALFREKAQRR